MINFSFIIPHKNTPELLNRCVASIPQREDVQIIVVDDNSDEEKKPKINRNHTIIVYLDIFSSKGAGHARNVGISKAKGKWLLFADADDYYEKELFTILDKYKNSEADVVYFNFYWCKRNYKKTNVLIDNYNGDVNDLDIIKFRTHAPWNKMISKKFITENNIIFEETVNGNDMFFTYQIGYLSKEVCVEKLPIYNYVTSTTDGMTNRKKNSDEYYLCRMHHEYQMNSFFSFIGHVEWKTLQPFRLFGAVLYKKGGMEFLKCFTIYLHYRHEILLNKDKFVNEILKRNNIGLLK